MQFAKPIKMIYDKNNSLVSSTEKEPFTNQKKIPYIIRTLVAKKLKKHYLQKDSFLKGIFLILKKRALSSLIKFSDFFFLPT